MTASNNSMKSIPALSSSTILTVLLMVALTPSRAYANPLADSGYDSVPSAKATSVIADSTITVSCPNTVMMLAQDRWAAIASGDLTKVMSQYSQSPSLHWIGGPLNGDYHGKENIQMVWQKLIKTQVPLKTVVSNLNIRIEPNTETVSALVLFSNGKAKIPVSYTLVYKYISGNYQLTEETWKIVKS